MSTPPHERSREVRVGLVMYGGVSLAVYINGVAQEFYQAVAGNGVYHLIKELTDSEIVLDIVSGSSAGGINGILLSYALANGKDFTPCAQLWRNAADIRRLVRSPFQSGTALRSVLDSEGYYQGELENAFRLLDGSPASGESPSPVRELDLFVTGTDIEGSVYSRVDDAGHAILLKDHRAVFHLKHREGRKSNFDASKNPAVVTALSKLARITSCFPGAFTPVFVPHRHNAKDPQQMGSNELLQFWGNLKHDAYYIDGGVIDNKPFTHTIREIFNRTADREVERRLYYVEPDPERFDQTVAPDGLEKLPPSFLKPIVDSLIAIPGYESIADDLKLLAGRNQDIHKYRRVLQDIEQAYSGAVVADCGVDVPADLPEPLQSIYKRSRFASISDRVLAGIFKNATFDNAPHLERQRADLIRVFDERTKASPQTLRDFDVYFRLRRAYHLVDFIYERLYKDGGSSTSLAVAEQYRDLLKALNEHIKRLHIICVTMERLVDEVDHGWSDSRFNDPSAIWDRTQAALHRLLHFNEGGLPLHDLSELNRVLKRRLENFKASDFDVPNFTSVLLKTDELELRLFDQGGASLDAALRRYRLFNITDAHLFPIEWVSGLREKDIVEVVRISPADAQRGFSRRPAPDKISGDSLAHFSAFFKRTWRSNDILWGRLDGLCELMETLLVKDRISQAMARPAARERARSVLLPENGPSPLQHWFADSSPEAIETIRQWVDSVTGDDDERRAAAIAAFYSEDSKSGEDIRDLLIEIAQFKIVNTCLPDLFEDSIKEQAEWNRKRSVPASTSEEARLLWTGGDVSFNGPAFEAFAKAGGKQVLQNLKNAPEEELWPRRTALGKAFESFRVGREEILGGGMPPLILAEIISRSLLVLRNCLLGSIRPSIAQKVRASFTYRWLVELPLRAIYGCVVFLKTAPAWESAVVATLIVLSLFALFVGIGWRDSIIYSGNALNISWFAVFILVPLAILLGSIYLFARTRLGRTSLSAGVRNAVTLLLVMAPLFSVALVYFGITDTLLEWFAGTSQLPDTRYTNLWIIFLYGIVPFILSFLGGYIAVREGTNKGMEPASLRSVLERLPDSELQDVADRMGHRFAVAEDNRRNAAAAIVSKAFEKGELGKLERAVRASSSELE